MRLKRMATAAAVAASVGMAGLSIAVVPAYADPPPCNQPNCQGGPGPHGPSGPPQQGPGGPPQQGPGGPPQHEPSGPPPNNAPNNAPDNGQRDFNGNGPQQQGPPQQGPQNQGPQNQGGPRNTPGGWRAPGQGAPPPPQAGRDGWNDGPPPGGPPRDWDGPPPPGGWNGPPPPGGWNRHWDGPGRDIDQARFDHQPFDYDDYQAVPIWAPDQGGWGFWFFGLWIPL
jgi:hypothetical protein